MFLEGDGTQASPLPIPRSTVPFEKFKLLPIIVFKHTYKNISMYQPQTQHNGPERKIWVSLVGSVDTTRDMVMRQGKEAIDDASFEKGRT